jgi:DnaJ homologue, subfamily C, member 28, conserved domain
VEIFVRIAEQRIREAIERGEFLDLRGKGKPLVFEDDTWVPEDLRPAYRILKNAGCVPQELELRNEVVTLRRLMETIDDDKERLTRIRELNFKLMKLNELRKRPFVLEEFPEYEEKVCRKFIP